MVMDVVSGYDYDDGDEVCEEGVIVVGLLFCLLGLGLDLSNNDGYYKEEDRREILISPSMSM